jgi:NTE family protein
MTILNRLLTSILLILPLVNMAQEVTIKTDRPKIALVLSGGGAKGFAHIGVLKVLEEEGIPIDIIVGTSMGSLVGGIYALGYSATEIEKIVKKQDWDTLLTDDVPRMFLSKNDQLIKQRYLFSLPINDKKKLSLPIGVIKGQNVLNLFCGLAANVPENADFSKFPVSFACVATDLETGKEVVLTKGYLPTAMFSSMAIPAAFQTSERDGMLLIDGGVVNNFPTDVAKRMGADIIIGVDIRNDFYDRRNLKSMGNVLGQLVNFFDQTKDSVNNSLCDVIIRPDITGFSISSFTNEAVDTLIDRGEKAAKTAKYQIQRLKEKYALEQQLKTREFVLPDKWIISDLCFTGDQYFDEAFLRKNLLLKFPGTYSYKEIKNAIDRLYGLGGFEKIYFTLTDNGNGKTLNLRITTNNVFAQNIGFKVNTTDAAALLLNTTRKNYGNVFGLLSFGMELSVHPGLRIIAESNKTNLVTFGIELKGKYQNYNIFDNGVKIHEADIYYSSGAIYLYQPFLKRYHIGIGVQEEYYHGDIFSKNSNYPITSNKMNYFLTNAYSYLSFDNMDDFYFPSKGSNAYAEFSLLADFKNAGEISPTLLFKMRNVIPAWHNTALLLDFYGRALYNSDSTQTRMTLVGGEPYSQYFNYHLPFVGLSAINIADRFTYIGLIGLRAKIANSQYVSLLFNVMRQSNEMVGYTKADVIYGGGVRYSLKTMFGPLDTTIG